MIPFRPLVAVVLGMLCVAATRVAVVADPATSPDVVPVVSSSPRAAGPGAAGLTPGGFLGGANAGGTQSYAAFTKTAERQSGLIDVLKKDDEIYFDLGSAQLDRPYIVAPVLASGVGEDTFAGRIFPTFLIEFHRVGKRVLWIDKNSFFSAPENSPAANALAISVTDSVINSTPIAAEDEKQQRIVISASFFLSDFENVGKDLGDTSDRAATLIPAARSARASRSTLAVRTSRRRKRFRK